MKTFKDHMRRAIAAPVAFAVAALAVALTPTPSLAARYCEDICLSQAPRSLTDTSADNCSDFIDNAGYQCLWYSDTMIRPEYQDRYEPEAGFVYEEPM